MGIKSQQEYSNRHKEDPRLPRNPWQFYEDRGWINLYEFLEKEKPYFYATYNEAKQAVQKLGIGSKTYYYNRYKEDPRLPSIPDRIYKGKGWISWPAFFGRKKKEFYQTYEEAKQAVQKLGIKSKYEYEVKNRHKEDPKLPSEPRLFYEGKGWTSWPAFFGKEKPSFYPTCIEAKQAVQELEIKFKDEYEKRYKEDSRLPSHPNEYYKDKGWAGWAGFLGRKKLDLYPTYEEAKQAVQKLVTIQVFTLGSNVQKQYHKRYKEDPRLPAAPDKLYKDKGWTGWDVFFGKEKSALYPTYEEAKQAVRRLRIKSESKYHKRYKEDPRLPGHPNRYYSKDWIDWYYFLGKKRKTIT